jgi:hypothetical protein
LRLGLENYLLVSNQLPPRSWDYSRESRAPAPKPLCHWKKLRWRWADF